MGKHTAKTKKTRRQNRILLVLEVLFALVALAALVVIVHEAGKYFIADQDFKQVTESTGRDVDKLAGLNGDAIGWVQVDDTRIDYPVMYTPDDPQHYLHRNFKDEESFAGTPFFGEGSDPQSATTNSAIIYSHHMRDGSMFGELEKFADSSWAAEHDISYTDADGEHRYQVIGAFYEDVSSGDYWHYWDQVGTLNEDAFNGLLKEVKKRSCISTKANAEYGDKLLTLSTCSYGTSEQRFAVVAVER